MSQVTFVSKLRVPELTKSLKKFLTVIKPMISDSSYSQIEKDTKSFANREAPYLQKKLLSFAETTDSWASDMWVESRFLSNRNSVLFSNSVTTVGNMFSYENQDEILNSVSAFILYVLNTVRDIRNGKFPDEMRGDVPLCTQQYERFTGVNRKVCKKTDKHIFVPKSRHIVVLHGGDIFKMPIYTSDNRIVSHHEVFQMLSVVVRYPRESADRVGSVGILTADDRDSWYATQEELVRSSVNLKSLKVIEESLFGICLDESTLSDRLSAGKLCSFGGKPGKFDIYNRWCDLGFQAAFTRDGYATFIVEHSLMDGIVIGNIFLNASDMKETNYVDSKSVDMSLKIELLEWEISPLIRSKMEIVKIKLSEWFTSYDTVSCEFEEFGNDLIWKHGLNLLGFFHLVIQLAYFKLYNETASAHIPVSLRRFRNGRLEHPQTTSEESKAFVEAMFDEGISDNNKWELIKRASYRLKETLAETSQGQVYFKHISALKKIADEEGMSVLLFENPSFDFFSLRKLVFSSLMYPGNLYGSYPNPDGHFVIFQHFEDAIKFSVTTIHSSSQFVSSEKLAQEIVSSLKVFNKLILSQTASKSKL